MQSNKLVFIAYYRVSDEKTQGRSGLGIAAQQEDVRRFVGTRGGEIIGPEYVEIESGKDNDRPELDKAIKRCRKTGACLLVSKLDRLSRDAGFLMSLRRSGVELAAANMPEANTLMFMVMAGMAQQEREFISERTIAALKAAKERGTVLGGPREGAPDIRRWQAMGAQATAKKAQEWAEFHREDLEPLVKMGLSLRRIASCLNEAAILTPHSSRDGARKQWSAQSVKNVIDRLALARC